MFRLTRKAMADLLSIGRYTAKNWGVQQRDQYISSLDHCFMQLASYPDMGEACDGIRHGYRKLPHGKHLIFYRKASGEQIEIVRILHKSMDISLQMDGEDLP